MDKQETDDVYKAFGRIAVYPHPDFKGGGISLKHYIMVEAMKSLMINRKTIDTGDMEDIAEQSHEMADAMIKQMVDNG